MLRHHLPDQRRGSPVKKLGDEHLKKLGLGLSGAHRTGKTTVAAQLAELNEAPFLTSSASQIAKDMGLKVDLGMAPSDRRAFQEEVLRRFIEQYEAEAGHGLFVTDRTPLDLAAYAMMDWDHRNTNPEHDAWLMDYVDRCMVATSQYFFLVGVIEPGIPYVTGPGKPAPNVVYQEGLNTTIMGLAYDPKVRSYVCVVGRDVLDTDRRCEILADRYADRVGAYQDNITAACGTH